MSHPLFDVTEFAFVADYTLLVRFDDDTAQTIDFEPVLCGKMFGPLRDQSFFRQVRLDPETKTLIWPNGADFDPYVLLHEWPRVKDQLILSVRAVAALPV